MVATTIGTRPRRGCGWLPVALALTGVGALVASAADRVVLCEEFMRTTCPYCRAAGPALDRLLVEYPSTLILVQAHTSPVGRTTPWGDSRRLFYQTDPNRQGVPDAWFDGVDDYLGANPDPNENYLMYKEAYETARGVPTDVTIDLSAVKVSAQARFVSARVAIESGGQGKTLRINMVQVLDHWPSDPIAPWTRNGLRQGATAQDITLTPGQSTVVTNTFTLGTDSLADEGNVRFVAWAQDPDSTGPAEVHNAAFVTGPFQFLTGDMNCDGVINYADINPFVLALTSQSAYEAQYPTCRELNADINVDTMVNYADINPFVSLLTSL